MRAIRHAWCGKHSVENNSRLEGVEVRAAIRATLHVLFDLAALGRVKLLVEIVANVAVDVDALLHSCCVRVLM